MRNYEAALKAQGFEIAFFCGKPADHNYSFDANQPSEFVGYVARPSVTVGDVA